jgi:hypothetical protein
MTLICARCIKSGASLPSSGFEPAVVRRGVTRAKPAVTVTLGEALCAEHLAGVDASESAS